LEEGHNTSPVKLHHSISTHQPPPLLHIRYVDIP
jgi:hypothetical protein